MNLERNRLFNNPDDLARLSDMRRQQLAELGVTTVDPAFVLEDRWLRAFCFGLNGRRIAF